MTRPRLDVGVLLPDALDIAADSENATVLHQRALWENVDVHVTEVRQSDRAPRHPLDVWILGSGPAEAAAESLDALRVHGSLLHAHRADGRALLAVGLGAHLLAARIEVSRGEWSDGVGLLSGTAPLLAAHASGELVAESPWGLMIGYENHAHGYTGTERAWGAVVSGVGRDGLVEGADEAGVWATHLHGPVLAKNPRFADHVLDTAMRRRHDVEFASTNDEAGQVDRLIDEARSAVLKRSSSSSRRPRPSRGARRDQADARS